MGGLERGGGELGFVVEEIDFVQAFVRSVERLFVCPSFLPSFCAVTNNIVLGVYKLQALRRGTKSSLQSTLYRIKKMCF